MKLFPRSTTTTSLLNTILLLSAFAVSSSSAFALAAKRPDLEVSKPKGDKNPNLICPADQASRWRAEIAHSVSNDEPSCKTAPHRDQCDKCVIAYAAAMTACIVACCVNFELGPAIAVCITGCVGVYEGAVGDCFNR